MSPLAIFIAEGAILIALPYVAWRYLGFRNVAPLAVVQVMAGLALGPSVLGIAAPDFQHWLFPDANLAKLSGVATISVVLFTFLTGMHLEERMVRNARPATLGIAFSSFLVPLLLGFGLGYWFAVSNPALVGPNAKVWEFAFGFGICIAVTALPVLAAILREMKIINAELGQQALGYAAINDAGLWVAVSVLLVITGSHAENPWRMAWIPVYLIVIIFFVPWLMRRVAAKRRDANGQQDVSDTVLIVACALAFCASVASEYVGLGYVVGAFLAGVAMPLEVRTPLIRRLDWPAALLLMPFFYMVTGLKTQADLLSSSMIWLVAASTAFAMIGKIAGVAIPSMLCGESWRRSVALGTLLQSKGLMEVLVVTIFMDAGIITPVIFSAVILVAIICTLATMPLTWLVAGGPGTREAVIGPRLQAGDTSVPVEQTATRGGKIS